MPALFFFKNKQHRDVLFLWPLGQAAKTTPSHGVIESSILSGVTIFYPAIDFLNPTSSNHIFLFSSVGTHGILSERSELRSTANPVNFQLNIPL